MTSQDPLKSALSIEAVDNTSLALPSVGQQFRSGEQRVLEQVQTIRRYKSRHSSSHRSASTSMSPTSPGYDSVFTSSSKPSMSSNGTAFFGNGLSNTLSFDKGTQRYMTSTLRGPTMKRSASKVSTYKHSSHAALGSMARGQLYSSQSEPSMTWQQTMAKSSAPSQRHRSVGGPGRSAYRTEVSKSQYITSVGPQQKGREVSKSQYITSVGPQQKGREVSKSQYITSVGPQQIGREVSKSQYITSVGPQQIGREVSKSQYITSVGPQPVPAPALNGTGPTRAKSKFLCNPVDLSTTMSKLPVVEFAQTTLKESSGSTHTGGIANLTMKEAVEYLSKKDETYQHWGASYIQHNTFLDDKAKEEVLKLKGIPPLVALLHNPSAQVRQTASAALRNLSFKNNNSKEQIDLCGGVAEAVALLRDTDSAETQKQLTGLLWNLSCLDSLKPELLKSALPVLIDTVVLPYTTGLDRSESDAEAFYNTTGCLRNLSSTKQSNRQTMRKHPILIDSLVRYLKDSLEAGKPDNKSVENCVCVLNNLSFQLEAEAPALFSRILSQAKPASRGQSQGDASAVGCFSPQSKSLVQERNLDIPLVEDPRPSGAGWLIHSRTLQTYLSLLDSSEKEETQEASCGVLQNLTANEGFVSNVLSQIVVQKLNGMQVLSQFLKSDKVNLQRGAVALIGNLNRNPNLHNPIARTALPELLLILSAGTKEGNESDDTLAMACQTANSLIKREPEMNKHLLSSTLIRSLNDLSQNVYFPKTKKAAAVLLYNLWTEKELQSFLKKQGMSKSSFVNDVTTAAHQAVQVVD
ncbi:plakophilin-1-like [Nelusetta ayraudi]|uniref:plakophilin-1-like n=1 Tax=Nelusetta ayraudi TaxID=303726 RepID=UPI003F6F3263